MSAQTRVVVRTLVPAGGGAGSDTTTGGRDFAVVGPRGRYIYYTDIAGAARVPLTGGAVQQLPTPPGHGSVTSVLADRSDTRFEETVGSAEASKPLEPVAHAKTVYRGNIAAAVTPPAVGVAVARPRTRA